MELGSFYFISDAFYQEFSNCKLLNNHCNVGDVKHDRPCFCIFKEQKCEIYWMIPISSKVDKYRRIFDSNIIKYGRCDSIVFGKLKGKYRAFLIQNIFPITKDFVVATYTGYKKEPIHISKNLQKDLLKKAKKAIALKRNGINTIFTDIQFIKEKLLETTIKSD